MSKVMVFDHPLIQHKLSILRDEKTSVKEFRELISEIAELMCYEATRNLPLEEVQVKTPVGIATCHRIAGKKLAVVPILRAGLGMVDGMVAMMPNVKVGHVGLYRDPQTLEPVKYYFKMPPDITERDVIVVDPMLATGGSAVAAVQFLKDEGVKNIKLMCIIAAPEGIEAMQKAHPDVDIFVAAKNHRRDLPPVVFVMRFWLSEKFAHELRVRRRVVQGQARDQLGLGQQDHGQFGGPGLVLLVRLF